MMEELLGATGVTVASTAQLERMVVGILGAAALGALLGYVPGRVVPWGRRLSARNAQTFTVLAAASALVVIVIGDSLARAFGLVGLGGIVRFRARLKEPRDAAGMFVAIGLGMAAGLGHLLVAAVADGLFVAILCVLVGRQDELFTATLRTADPLKLLGRVREKVEDGGLALEREEARPGDGTLVVVVRGGEARVAVEKALRGQDVTQIVWGAGYPPARTEDGSAHS